jgi:hypothetical protein
MPTISGRQVFGGAGSQANVFLGSQYELAPFDGTIEIGCTQTVANACTLAVFSGPDILQEPGGSIPVYTTEQFPKYPDDYHWEDEVAKGDRLKLALVATAACTVNWVMRLTPA